MNGAPGISVRFLNHHRRIVRRAHGKDVEFSVGVDRHSLDPRDNRSWQCGLCLGECLKDQKQRKADRDTCKSCSSIHGRVQNVYG